MNRTIIFTLLIASIALSMIPSALGIACCRTYDANDNPVCQEVGDGQEDDLNELCASEGGDYDTSTCETAFDDCTDPSSTDGVCCLSNGYRDDVSSGECWALGGGWADSVDACQDPTIPDLGELPACSDFASADLEFTASDVKGAAELELTWNLCEGIESITLEGDGGTLIDASGDLQRSFVDREVQWRDQGGGYYSYTLTVQTTSGELTATAQEDTGDSACDGITASTTYCSDLDVVRCDAENRYSTVDSCDDECSNGRCSGDSSICSTGSIFLGSMSSSFCEQEIATAGTCYYDRSATGVNDCYPCATIESCYTLKSEYACTNAETVCGFSGCTWQSTPDADGAGIGAGFCKPVSVTESICEYVNAPRDETRAETYSPLLVPTAQSFGDDREEWFSAAESDASDLQCTGSAITSAACIDILVSTQQGIDACNEATMSGGYDCRYRNDGYCAKYDYDSPEFGVPLSGEYLCDSQSGTCENDATPPQATINIDQNNEADTIDFRVRVFDAERTEPYQEITGSALDDYRIIACVSTDEDACTSLSEFNSIELSNGIYTHDYSGMQSAGPVVFAVAVLDPGFNTGQIRRVTAFADPTDPSVVAELMGQSTTVKLTSVPSSVTLTIRYEDDSRITDLSYDILYKPVGGSVRTLDTIEVPNPPADEYHVNYLPNVVVESGDYQVVATVTDQGGNDGTGESNVVNLILPDQCENEQPDPDETDVDCGGPTCGASCDIGQKCDTRADCAGSDQALCIDGVCALAHCSDGNQSGDETGIDCGGSCGACLISLVEPTFGITSESSPRVVIETGVPMQCSYKTPGTSGSGFSFDQPDAVTTTHVIDQLRIASYPEINVTCVSQSDGVQSAEFSFTYDDTEPTITFGADPALENRKKANGEYETVFVVNSPDIDVLCKISDEPGDYEDLDSYLGEEYATGSELNRKHYVSTQNELFGFAEAGTYKRYATCLAVNGETAGPVSATFRAGPDVQPEVDVVDPKANQLYGVSQIPAVVDGTSEGVLACSGQFEEFSAEPLTKDPESGSVFRGTITLVEGESLDYTGICEYLVGNREANASDTVRFAADLTDPYIETVSISDPYSGSTSSSTTKNGIAVRIDARDDETYIARYNFTITVNDEAIETSLPLRFSDDFTVNGLNLSAGDSVELEAVVFDAAENRASETSNTLTIADPPEEAVCNVNGEQDGNETGTDCGGPNCEACSERDECTLDTDCDSDLFCNADNVCEDIDNICDNGEYDEDYETSRDCGGICGACTDGGSCNSQSDCADGYYCSTDRECVVDYLTICGNEELDEKFETDVDCGDVCAVEYDQVCAVGDACTTNADCTQNAICKGGVCSSNVTTQVKSWCEAEEFNNTLEDGTFCGRGCADECTEGVGCRSAADCEGDLVCNAITNVCEADDRETELPSEKICSPTDSTEQCGGTCEPCEVGLLCEIDSDCESDNCDGGLCAESYDDIDVTQGNTTTTGGTEEGGIGVWKWVIFFLLIVLLGVAGYIAYVYYYLPSKKPDYQDQPMNADTMQASFDDLGSSDASVNPPSAPPVMTDKQQHVNELIRRKRSEEKEKKRDELFSAFDSSKLDEGSSDVDPDTVPATKLESTPDDEKPIVPARKKSHDSFKEILDDAKDDVE